MCIVGRQRRHLKSNDFEAKSPCFVHTSFFIPDPLFSGCLVGRVHIGRQRRYLEAGVFSSSGGLVGSLRSRASACVP